MTMVSLDRLRDSPNPVGTALAAITGVGLLIIGTSWLALDRSLLAMALACAVVGLLALPPIGHWVRARLGAGAFSHWLAGLGALAAAFAWTVAGPTANSMNARFANNPAPVALISTADAQTASAVADTAQAKSAYLQNIAAAQSEFGAVDPASFAGGREAVMAGVSAITAWRALGAQASTFALSPEEQAQVDAFNAAAQKQSAALMPALRRAYADSLRDALSGFGVTAEASGDRAQSIAVVGYALNDQSVLNRVRTLLNSDLAALGFTQTNFVSDRQQGQAAMVTPASATQTATPAPAVIAAAGPSVPAL